MDLADHDRHLLAQGADDILGHGGDALGALGRSEINDLLVPLHRQGVLQPVHACHQLDARPVQAFGQTGLAGLEARQEIEDAGRRVVAQVLLRAAWALPYITSLQAPCVRFTW